MLALSVFAQRLGGHDSELTYTTGLDLALDEANRLEAHSWEAPSSSAHHWYTWFERVEVLALLREAEEMLGR